MRKMMKKKKIYLCYQQVNSYKDKENHNKKFNNHKLFKNKIMILMTIKTRKIKKI